jgi:phosphatidylserine/phosphatidylglycerophosphate/cardiolipin synthase-like enzyme
MRNRVKQSGTKAISVNAIGGTYVVLLAMDANAAARKGLLGFAIHRTDKTENEQYWLTSFRTFEAINPNPAPGSLVSTQEAPIQGFMWGDYTACPNHEYVYKVVPVYGAPKNFVYGKAVEVEIKTEDEDFGEHAIYFNRGVAGSQAYARKFGNKTPEAAGPEAFKWLSRGLEESILGFIGKAKGKSYSIRAAAYEFSHVGVLGAFKAASKTGADVKIVYDCRKPDPQKTSKAAIKKAGISKLMIPRKSDPNFISHNKFIILLKNNKPVEVLTGSTNFTDGGIYGQSNVVHIVRDPKIAQNYLDYWTELSKDTPAKSLRPWNVENTPTPGGKFKDKVLPIFSPRTSLDALQWYSDGIDKAIASTGFTAAFGVNKLFAAVLAKNKKNVRYVLLEKTGPTYDQFSKMRNNFISIGAVLNQNIVGDSELHRWVGEKLSGLNSFVKYLHTKYLFIDPLSKNPTVISGSANFSDASTVNNDENMLVIKGNTTVADIYLGEFMRLWNHFYFRDIANRYANINSQKLANPGSKKTKAPTTTYSPYLVPDDSWTDAYYGKNFRKTQERELFK